MSAHNPLKYPRVWEDITNDKQAGCSRLKIYGGWLVVFWAKRSKHESRLFISDPNHEWELEDKIKSRK